jgi:hypothetical protein
MQEEENKPELGLELGPERAVVREVHQCQRGVPDDPKLELAQALVGMAMPELEWVLAALVPELLEALVVEAVEEAQM